MTNPIVFAVPVCTRLAGLGAYAAVYQHAALLHLPAGSPWVWAGALIACVFLYDWHHRLGHPVHLLWAAHGEHHSSGDHNLGTALRQTGSGFLFGWLFYLPMALAGVPPLVFVVVGLVDLLYQLWVHTPLVSRRVSRLGWADRVFVTPSNHLPHHGQNSWCIDRKDGGILILRNRLFGTFADVRAGEPVVYGIRSALRSWTPLWANAQGCANIARAVATAPRWRDKLRLPFMPPGWLPPDAVVPPQADLSGFRPHAPPIPAALAADALLQLAVLVALALHFLVEAARCGLGALLLAASPLHRPAWWALWAVAGLVTAAAPWRAAGHASPVAAGR